MANTLTNLIPTLYNALDVVSREMVGFIPAVSRDATADRAAVGQVVRSFVAPAAASIAISPGVTAPDNGDQVIGNTTITISKSKMVPIRWNGEETLGLSSPGITAQRILQDQFAQAMRTLCNEVEVDCGIAAYAGASRATGTVGTNPFLISSDKTIDNVADILKILKDNGAADSDLQLVIDTTAGAGMRKVPGLFRANEAGETSLLRQGVLGSLYGFDIRESAGVARPTVGTITATTNSAGYAVGATAITLSSAAVALVKGDVITFNGDTNRYVVAADLSGTGGILTLAAPGLRQPIPTSTTAITVLATGPRNVAFSRSAIYLATRAPASPDGGDMADDRTIVQDPRSGLAFEVSLYRQYRQVKYEVALAWGVANVKAEHSAILLG
jgi:hypothetical protein